MSTILKSILPIPESVIMGSGSYVIPANKYAYINANTSTATYGLVASVQLDYGISVSASANRANQWLVEGDTVNTQASYPAATRASGGGVSGNLAYSMVTINGSVFCTSNAGGGFATNTSLFGVNALASSGYTAWSVSLFPIPKNNLPSQLIEGN